MNSVVEVDWKYNIVKAVTYKTIVNFQKFGIFSDFWELKLLYYFRKSFKKFETGADSEFFQS